MIFGRCSRASVAHLVEVDALVARRHAVAHEVVELAAGVHRRAVGEVAALVEAQAEDLVARVEQRQVDGHVGVGAGVGLHVGVRGAEELLGPVAGDVLDLVDDLVAAVVPLGRVALAVLVGEHRARGPQHRRRGEVLAGDELEGGVLALDLPVDQPEDLVVVVLRPGHGQLDSSRSMSAIWATRRSWRPPSKGVASHSSRISLASPKATMRPAHRQDVGVVVLPAQPGGEQVVAERGAHAVHLVGGDLLALPGPAEHDAAVGLAGRRRPGPPPRRSAGSRPTRCRGCRGRSARGRAAPAPRPGGP